MGISNILMARRQVRSKSTALAAQRRRKAVHSTTAPVQSDHQDRHCESPRYDVNDQDFEDSSSDRQDSDKTLVNQQYAQPLHHPAWWGCIQIGGAVFNRLAAHLSDKACFKAVEAAKSMPAVLCTKTAPRMEVLPKSFHGSPPTDENIAMYFFPESESSYEGYDILVDQIVRRDLAMRILLKDAELLVFGSDQLPLQLRRFCGRHYLWGVFRGRCEDPDLKGSSESSQSSSPQ